MPDFLDLHAVGADALRRILDDAHAVKARLRETWDEAPLRHRTLAMVFDKPSTRTRVSFDVGMRQLGGETIVLDATGTQMGRGETIADTARVLSRYVDAIMIRTTGHDRLGELAEHATVPVINGLTDETHPCQIMADVMCYEEHRETIRGRTVAWTGDGNNVCATLVEAAPLFGFRLRCATPEGFEPAERFVRAAEGHVELTNDPRAAVEGADLVVTDTWHSMGGGGAGGGDAGHNTFAPYRVDKSLMALAAPDALFMHCLPAHRGEEVTDEVMDGPPAPAHRPAVLAPLSPHLCDSSVVSAFSHPFGVIPASSRDPRSAAEAGGGHTRSVLSECADPTHLFATFEQAALDPGSRPG